MLPATIKLYLDTVASEEEAAVGTAAPFEGHSSVGRTDGMNDPYIKSDVR